MLKVELTQDGVYIYNQEDTSEGPRHDPIVHWTKDEWESRPQDVPAICRAVLLAALNPSRLRLVIDRPVEYDAEVAAYIDRADRVCPQCTALMEKHEEFDVDGSFGWQDVYCPECKLFFTEVYRLVDLTDIQGV